ncbi:winged helix-turn-helix domain-containing protein [Nannocystis pusilla]|uniref:winged helix-turn-helix domain-containing protein n=1 Tax=Nannocystis pusilla TaxID=889268 RepID=UPI003BEFA664
MKLLEAVETILREAGGPLHYKEITERVLARRLWNSEGQTPARTVNSSLAVHIQENDTDSLFVRTAPGVFGLRHAPVRKGAPDSRQAKSETSTRKLGTQEIKNLARQIVKNHPDGIRYRQIISLILDEYPATIYNTIEASIWNLDAQFPAEIHKPSRGLFKPGPAGLDEDVEPEISTPNRPREDMFYAAFADLLMRDLEDATDAVPLGGASLRSKWSTPDVIGVYKPLPSDRIKFPTEIISAEIKIDPHASVVAFGQAIAYRLFSTKSYIVMPDTLGKEEQDRVEALSMLFGIGFVLFNPNPQQPDFRIRMRAQRFSPDMYFVNEFAEGLHRHDRTLFNRLFQ